MDPIWLTALGVLTILFYAVRNLRGKSNMTKPSVKSSISISEARALVDDLISRGQLVRGTIGQDATQIGLLGPSTAEFFRHYGEVRTKNGGFELSAAAVHPSEYMKEYISIGHSEDWDVIQKPGDDEVLVVEGSENSVAEIEVRFPSVYHLLIDEANQSSE